jgi:hypothetical protein
MPIVDGGDSRRVSSASGKVRRNTAYGQVDAMGCEAVSLTPVGTANTVTHNSHSLADTVPHEDLCFWRRRNWRQFGNAAGCEWR